MSKNNFFLWITCSFLLARLGIHVAGTSFWKMHRFALAPFANLASSIAIGCVLAFWLTRLQSRGSSPIVGGRGAYRKYFMLVLLVILVSGVAGLLRGWPRIGVLADTTYLFLGVAVYFAARTEFLRGAAEDGEEPVSQWLVAARWAAVISIGGAVLGLPIPYPILAVVIVSLLLCVSVPGKGRTAPLFLVALALPLPQLGRTFLLMILAGIVLFILSGSMRRIASRVAVVALVVLPVALLTGYGWIVDATGLSESKMAKGLGEILKVSLDPEESEEISVAQRVFEAIQVMDAYEDAGLQTWIAGHGSGATLDMSFSRDCAVRGSAILGEERVHNIHILPFAFFYRHGMLGVLLLTYFSWVVLCSVLRSVAESRRRKRVDFGFVAATYIALALLDGMVGATHFITNPIVPLLAAYLDVRARRRDGKTLDSVNAKAVEATQELVVRNANGKGC